MNGEHCGCLFDIDIRRHRINTLRMYHFGLIMAVQCIHMRLRPLRTSHTAACRRCENCRCQLIPISPGIIQIIQLERKDIPSSRFSWLCFLLVFSSVLQYGADGPKHWGMMYRLGSRSINMLWIYLWPTHRTNHTYSSSNIIAGRMLRTVIPGGVHIVIYLDI